MVQAMYELSFLPLQALFPITSDFLLTSKYSACRISDNTSPYTCSDGILVRPNARHTRRILRDFQPFQGLSTQAPGPPRMASRLKYKRPPSLLFCARKRKCKTYQASTFGALGKRLRSRHKAQSPILAYRRGYYLARGPPA